jgi:hypothetical protein
MTEHSEPQGDSRPNGASSESVLTPLIGGPYDGQELLVSPGETEKRVLVDLWLFEANDNLIDSIRKHGSPAKTQAEFYLWYNQQLATSHKQLSGNSGTSKTAIYRRSSDSPHFQFVGYVDETNREDI